MALKGNPEVWETGTKIAVIRDALQGHPHTGTDCRECKRAARSLYDAVGTEPLIFKSKVDGRMVELPKGKERWQRFMNLVREVHAYVDAGDFSEASEPSVKAPETGCGGCDNGECCQNGAAGTACGCCGKPIKSEPVKPTAVQTAYAREARLYYEGVQIRRAFVRGRKGVESLDSMRIVIDGVAAILQGVPKEALWSAIEAPWPTETRNQCRNFRPTAADLKPVTPEGFYDYAAFAPRPSTFAHGVSEYVLRLAAANVPVWLHGPAGTGKSSAAVYAAKQLDLKYYEVNLAGAMVSAVKGKDRLKEFVESEAMTAFEEGGLLCLEEFDSAHPSVGTALNTMLAVPVGGTYSNDAAGRKYVRHPNFRVIVTANSLGYGSAEFKRNDLDGATKDRFRIGRTYVGLDLELEAAIFESKIA
jgi:hypothetical protein